jgi:hypothetical protein
MRTRNCLVVTVGAAAGLFFGALATSAAAAADPAAPTSPAPNLSGWVEQMVTSSGSLPQQLLQTTTSALTGAPATPAAPPPVASASINMPPQTTGSGAGLAPTAPAGLPGVPGLPGSGDLTEILPFPLPNLGTTPTVPGAVPAPTVPQLGTPSVPGPSGIPLVVPGLP